MDSYAVEFATWAKHVMFPLEITTRCKFPCCKYVVLKQLTSKSFDLSPILSMIPDASLCSCFLSSAAFWSSDRLFGGQRCRQKVLCTFEPWRRTHRTTRSYELEYAAVILFFGLCILDDRFKKKKQHYLALLVHVSSWWMMMGFDHLMISINPVFHNF